MNTLKLTSTRTWIAALSAGLGAWGGILGSDALAQGKGGNVVYCYDEKLDVVRNVPPSRCKGRVIGKAEADEVKARRLRRIRNAVKGAPPPVAPGMRLAGTGSGFFVTPDGKLVTNNHVIDGCSVLAIWPPWAPKAKAKLLDVDVTNDLALLHAPLRPAETVVFRYPVQRLADRRIALFGYPRNKAVVRITPSLTPGHTLTPRNPREGFLGLRFKADVRPGNSGGPLLDESGYVIGVVTAKINTVNVAKQTGEVIRDEGYATDNILVFRFLEKNRVPYRKLADGAVLSEKNVFAAARRFAARIECWK